MTNKGKPIHRAHHRASENDLIEWVEKWIRETEEFNRKVNECFLEALRKKMSELE